MTKTKEQIRMELFKEVYLQYAPQIQKYTKNIAEIEAINAVTAFDKQFKSVDDN